ncbi:unknow [Vibrio campbellii]|nr:unknow [Vibrio campbellii]
MTNKKEPSLSDGSFFVFVFLAKGLISWVLAAHTEQNCFHGKK